MRRRAGRYTWGLSFLLRAKPGDRLLQASEELAEKWRMPVSVVVGPDLVEFFLQHGADLLRT